MPELFIELFSEEIPARMQAGGAAALATLVTGELSQLIPPTYQPRSFFGPRRIALSVKVETQILPIRTRVRGPRVNATEQALTGFLRKHGASRDDPDKEDGYWVLETTTGAVPARDVIASKMPEIIRRFPWPKSMRWGSSAFTWVRPLRRIICLLDGDVVPFDLREGGDDAHGLASSNVTEGHRFHAPGAFTVTSCAEWQETLAERRVLVDAVERRRRIAHGIEAEATARGFTVVDDPGLLDEVAGLVEWPVPLLGRIDPAYMDLPQEVMQVSMRVNQRYFALRTPEGDAAPWFGFVANIDAEDGGATIIAGNERVLRARFADARHFWDLDRRTKLADRVPALDSITFHAKLGTQGERVRRLRRLATIIAPLVGANPAIADRAAELAKADLVTGMVGEFPELQGVMGSYYARHDEEWPEVAVAIHDHYAPKGPYDAVPTAPVSIAVALADKLDQLAGFFAIDEKPTGSGDPYALRRAGLGVIRIIREAGLRIPLRPVLQHAVLGFADLKRVLSPPLEVVDFLVERLRIQLRSEGARHDVLTAVFAAADDDDIIRLLARTEAVALLLSTQDGVDLLTAYRRAANILRIEDRKDGPHNDTPDSNTLRQPEERALVDALDDAEPIIDAELTAEHFGEAMSAMASLRPPLDAFFDRVTVNDPDPELRRNRLRLLNRVRATMDRVADFSKIEG